MNKKPQRYGAERFAAWVEKENIRTSREWQEQEGHEAQALIDRQEDRYQAALRDCCLVRERIKPYALVEVSRHDSRLKV